MNSFVQVSSDYSANPENNISPAIGILVVDKHYDLGNIGDNTSLDSKLGGNNHDIQ